EGYAARTTPRGAVDARVVVVDAGPVIFTARGQHNARADRAHRALEVESRAVAQRAAFDVCLLGWHPSLGRVRGERGSAQVVRHAAALVLEVGLVAVLEHDRAHHGERAAVDDDHLAAVVSRADGGLHRGGVLAWQWRCDEARHIHAAIGRDGDVSGGWTGGAGA